MRWFEKWMRMHTQFRARISYHNILLIVAEMHLKFNTHPSLCRTNSGPSKENSVSLWWFSSFLRDHRRSWCLTSFIPVTTGSTTVLSAGCFKQPLTNPSTEYFCSSPAPFSPSVCPERLAYVLAPHSLLCTAPLHFISAWASARFPAIPNSSYPKWNKHQ